ncbi:hypothetical protein JCM8097_003458 [Rhodosporidiobolus ruineniae]
MARRCQGATKTPLLLRLPPSVLHRIFTHPDQPVQRANLAICRALLPYTLAGLYQHVVLVSRKHILEVDKGFKARPELFELVRFCAVDVLALQAKTAAEPAQLDQLALFTLLTKMRNLENLCIKGQETARAFLLDWQPDWEGLSPSSYLPPRSLSLRVLFFSAPASFYGPEYRSLFAACSNTLESFHLTCSNVAPSFPDDVSLLPASLRALTLDVGYFCPAVHLNPPGRFPVVDSALLSFPLLERLAIFSDLLDDVRSLKHLKRLTHLTLGPHTSSQPSYLLALLPPTLPRLRHLFVRLCSCPQNSFPSDSRCPGPSTKEGVDDPATRRFVRDGEALLRAAAEKDVIVEGSIRCALGMCRPTEEHKKWCTGFGV